MRLDKYLKVSRLIKRRAVGKELALDSRVYINDKVAKPSSEVKAGDVLKIVFGNRQITVQITRIANQMKKNEEPLFEIIRQSYHEDEEGNE